MPTSDSGGDPGRSDRGRPPGGPGRETESDRETESVRERETDRETEKDGQTKMDGQTKTEGVDPVRSTDPDRPTDRAPTLSRRHAVKTALAGAVATTLSYPTVSGERTATASDEQSVPSTAEQPPQSRDGWDGGSTRLHVDGALVRTAAGDRVTLRGLSIVDPKRAAEEVRHRGIDAVGIVDAVTDTDAGWHPTVIRIPVQPIDIGGHEPMTGPQPIAFDRRQLETYLATYLDPVVEKCAREGVYAIVDFHRHYPGIEWGDLSRGTINEALQVETLLFWNTVAPRYAAADHVLYEMYNEPTEPGMWGPPDAGWVRPVWELYLEFAQPIVDAIRAHTDTVVLVGSPGWSQSPEGALVEPLAGGNVAYTLHVYPGHESSRALDWEDASLNGDGVEHVHEKHPLFVTEFGWRDYDHEHVGGTTSGFGEPFVSWMEAHGIHWTAWCADVQWGPRMFDLDEAGEWRLLGRDAGTKEDSGEYIRQALATGGVPQTYWDVPAGITLDNGDDGVRDGDRDDVNDPESAR